MKKNMYNNIFTCKYGPYSSEYELSNDYIYTLPKDRKELNNYEKYIEYSSKNSRAIIINDLLEILSPFLISRDNYSCFLEEISTYIDRLRYYSLQKEEIKKQYEELDILSHNKDIAKK